MHNNLNKTVLIIFFVRKYIIAMNIKLRNLREAQKISQSTMAKTLNISQPQYQQKEVGEVSFTTDELEIFAGLLDVPVEDIKDNEGLMQNNYNQKGGIAQTVMVV